MKVGSLCTGIGGIELGLPEHDLAFVAENDKSCSDVLEARFPSVPNLGDITSLDTLPECDILVSGFPCQPSSPAGNMLGLDDPRWVWNDIVRLLGSMDRPPFIVFIENVFGLRTASGGRAIASVVGGLRSVGYVGRWRHIAAADAGACHKRLRIFFLAWLPGVPVGEALNVERRAIRPLVPTPTVADSRRTRSVTSPRSNKKPSTKLCWTLSDVAYADRWNDFRAHLDLHERVVGRPMPIPAVDGKVTPRFVEWMMLLPEGWVTDIIGSARTSLRLLGNAVVPRQAALAWESLGGWVFR